MDTQRAIRIQSYLDNALPSEQRREVEAWLSRDPEARTLHERLSQLKGLVAANEPEPKLPETREFYWAQLKRQIAAAEPPRAEHQPTWSILRRFKFSLLPIAVAIVIVAGILWAPRPTSNRADSAEVRQELANVLDDDNTISFYSPEAKMTVVWVDFHENQP